MASSPKFVTDISNGLPAVVAFSVAFPFYVVSEFLIEETTVEDFFYFVFLFVIDNDGSARQGDFTVNLVAFVQRQARDVKDIVCLEYGREFQTLFPITNVFDYFVGSELPWTELGRGLMDLHLL